MTGRLKKLQHDIDLFLEGIAFGVVELHQTIAHYLANEEEDFIIMSETLAQTESRLDHLRRKIERNLYKYMLIPESRGDILRLLEHMDDVVNFSEDLANAMRAERPKFTKQSGVAFLTIANKSELCAKALCKESRNYFYNQKQMSKEKRGEEKKENVLSVKSYEREIDKLFQKAREELFADTSLDLTQKIHIRYFFEKLADISDIAEDVSESLAISVLKRAL